MEKPRDYKNTYQTPSGTKKGMRDAEVCTEDIIPSVQTEDPFEAFSVQTAPTWGSLKIVSMPLRVSSVRNISPLKISYIVNELLSNNIIIKKANQKKMDEIQRVIKVIKKTVAWKLVQLYGSSLLKNTRNS